MLALNWPWIDSPFFKKLLEQSSLDEEIKKLVKYFADNGYLIIELELENFDSLAEQIIQELAPLYGDKGRVKDAWFSPKRIQDAWTFSQAVRTLATAPKILSLLRILYQREPIPFQTLNFPVGTEQRTHSDTLHFHSVPARFMCGVWVALEDVDSNNGPLHYYPGSHKLPIFDLSDIGLCGSYQEKPYEGYPFYEDFIQSLIEAHQLEKVDISIRKGQAIIWAANLLHGGSPILDFSRTRHSQVTHFYFSDCMYYLPLHSDLFLKRICIKGVKNILTGEAVPHAYNGRKVQINNSQSLKIYTGREPLEIYTLKDKLEFKLNKVKTKLNKVKLKR